jgi:Asp-tRNA(Asn)/Glu-tRNA(Gln) amidotransferase A subunit family amidase
MPGVSEIKNLSATDARKYGFIEYWPFPDDGTQLKLAVKDNIDVKGTVATAGCKLFEKTNAPAQKDAACLAIARERHVPIIGKTVLSEFAIAPSGSNDAFATPKSPLSRLWPRIPGGSSSGSAVAVARGVADVALGTDTAGSVRVPAACCGVVGLKTTFGLVPLEGVHPIDPDHLDTIGPLAKNIDYTAKGMDLLVRGFGAQYEAAAKAGPDARAIRIGRLYLPGTHPSVDRAVDRALAAAGFEVVPLRQDLVEKWIQAKKDGNTVAAAAAWKTNGKYLNRTNVSTRSKGIILLGFVNYPRSYQAALNRKAAWQRALNETFRDVDFIALPTLQNIPPAIPLLGKTVGLEARMLDLQNTVPVNFAGNPALAIPIPIEDREVAFTSIQLIGPKYSEAELLNAGRHIEVGSSPILSVETIDPRQPLANGIKLTDILNSPLRVVRAARRVMLPD